MPPDHRSVLLVHHQDLTTPFGSTVPHYLAAELSDDHTVHVLCRALPDQRDGDGAPEGVVFHDLDTGDRPPVSGLLFVVLSAVYAVLLGLRYRYDAVYSFQGDVLQGWLGARAGGSRFVVGLQSVPVRQARDLAGSGGGARTLGLAASLELRSLYALLVGPVLERATAVVCLTEGIREVTESVHDVDLTDAHVIGMGIDVGTFASASARAGAHASDEPWTVTYLGTVNEMRGLDRVVEAVADTDHDVRLRVAGTGPDEYLESLQSMASESGICDRFELLGLVPHEEVPEVLDSSDIAISPLPDVESYRISFPAKLLEYMAAECLVVASRIPPHERLVDDGTNGFLYDTDSAVACRRALERCIEAAARHPEIRRAARRTAEDHRWERVVSAHEHVAFGGREPTTAGRSSPTTA
jgi:glycosyltransferase involved in cell wall biosynthesis